MRDDSREITWKKIVLSGMAEQRTLTDAESKQILEQRKHEESSTMSYYVALFIVLAAVLWIIYLQWLSPRSDVREPGLIVPSSFCSSDPHYVVKSKQEVFNEINTYISQFGFELKPFA